MFHPFQHGFNLKRVDIPTTTSKINKTLKAKHILIEFRAIIERNGAKEQ